MKQQEEVVSPDAFAPPKRPKEIKRINKRGLAIFGVLLSVFLGVVAYVYHERANPAYGAKAEEEPIRIERTVSPIKRPEPEIRAPVMPMPTVDSMGAPVAPGLTEEEKRRISKMEADMQAADAAPSRVQARPVPTNNRNQQQQTQGYQPGGLLVPGRNALDADGNPQGESNHEANARKQAFLNPDDSGPYLKNTRMAPLSEFELKAGWVIPGAMITWINSMLPGQIIGQVSQNVYDSATGRAILIPAGAKLIGWYDVDISTGQDRVLVAWKQVKFPDGSSLDLGTMPGADQGGMAGMKDKVDNHYWRIFGQAAVLSILSAGFQLGQPNNNSGNTVNTQQIFASAIGLQAAALAGQLLRKNMNTAPTLEIRPGFKFTVMVTKDIILPPWIGHQLAD